LPFAIPSQNGAIHIAQRDQPRAFHRAERFDVAFAATVEADDGDANVIVRADDARLDGGLGEKRPGFERGGGQQ
jgi:hypothetical protein